MTPDEIDDLAEAVAAGLLLALSNSPHLGHELRSAGWDQSRFEQHIRAGLSTYLACRENFPP